MLQQTTREGATGTSGRRASQLNPGRKGTVKGDDVRGYSANADGSWRAWQATGRTVLTRVKSHTDLPQRGWLAAEEARRPFGSLCWDCMWQDSDLEQNKDEGSNEKWTNSHFILKALHTVRKKEKSTVTKVFGLRHWKTKLSYHLLRKGRRRRNRLGEEYSALWKVPLGVLSILMV